MTFISLLIAVQLNAPKNLFYNVDFDWMQSYIKPKKELMLNNQNINTPLAQLINDSIPGIPGFSVNKNTFARTTGSDGYNPFVFNSFNELRDDDARFNAILTKGLAWSDHAILDQLEIGFNSFRFSSNSKSSAKIHISQNYHHNWKLYSNAIPIPITKNQDGLMTAQLQPGYQVIQLIYHDFWVSRLLALSLMCLLTCTGYLFYYGIKRLKS